MIQINTVAIIEDDPIHVFLTKRHIEKFDLIKNIIVYKNGKTAYDGILDLFNTNENLPEIIFLDINMPVWDGWEFLEAFLKIPIKQKIQIYILTSSNDEDDLKKAQKYNLGDFYITKPIDGNQLTKIFLR